MPVNQLERGFQVGGVERIQIKRWHAVLAALNDLKIIQVEAFHPTIVPNAVLTNLISRLLTCRPVVA